MNANREQAIDLGSDSDIDSDSDSDSGTDISWAGGGSSAAAAGPRLVRPAGAAWHPRVYALVHGGGDNSVNSDNDDDDDDDDDNDDDDNDSSGVRRGEDSSLASTVVSVRSPAGRKRLVPDRRGGRGRGRGSGDGAPSRRRRGSRGSLQGDDDDDDDDTTEDDNTTEDEPDDDGSIEGLRGANVHGGGTASIRSILSGERGADSDVDGDDDEGKCLLHFGMDPARSYSDWTITIQPTRTAAAKHEASDDDDVDDDDGPAAMATERSYHVHRCVMAVGPRRSLYFRRAFDLPFRERHAGASTIALEPLAARAFPVMLEYIYGAEQGSDLEIHSDNAVPVRFLARYFEVPAMRGVVIPYIASDLSPTNCHIYYRHASIFQDEDVLRAVEALCSIKPLTVCQKNPALMKITGLDFWFRIVGTWRGSALRRRSSTLLAHLIRAFPDDFTADRFRDFTDPDLLPVVRGTALAKDLLRMEKELLRIGPCQGAGQTSLQTRCVDAFARHQRTTGDAASERDLTAFLQAEHPLLLGPLLLKILEHERAAKRPVRPIRPPPSSPL